MKRSMISTRHHLEILQSIVNTVAVLMMNNLMRIEHTPQCPLYHQAVLQEVTSSISLRMIINEHPSVPIGVDV